MVDDPQSSGPGPAAAKAGFPTTRWSAVRAASDAGPERQRGWATLVAAYFRPSYKHVRLRWRLSPEDAEDAIQAFFTRAMEKDFFASYDPEKGRFRTFLRVCLDRFVSNEHKAGRREKRGSGVVPLDFEAAERELGELGSGEDSPEEHFDREWRRSVLTLSIEALKAELDAAGKGGHFLIFERYDLCDGPRPTYEELGRDLGIPATTVTNHLAYARRELRRLVTLKLAELTGSDRELRDEERAVFGGR